MTRENDQTIVDMLATARVAQGVEGASRVGFGAVKVIAPAKVNLYLEIGGRRADGYHDVTTVMHALTLHDVLYLNRARPDDVEDLPPAPDDDDSGLRIRLTGRSCEGIPELDVAPQDNIVSRAARALALRTGRGRGEALLASLEKHIPSQAGLGGGSADAAAALVGCAKLWGLEPDDPRIEEVARTLGADVPFFLHGGCARLGGTGGTFERALCARVGALLLVKPAGGVSTRQAYGAFDADPAVIGDADRERARAAERAADVPLCNNLAPASEGLLPVLAEVRVWLAGQVGARAVLLAGSGSTTFALCESFAQASGLASAAQQRGWWARATTFSPIRAAIVP